MDSKSKKVLIITYYWPPSAGGGVQRWLKFAKHLPSYGWEPIIYTPLNPDYSLKDDSLLGDIDPHLTVLKKSIWEPYSLLRVFSKSGQSANTGQVQKDSTVKKLASWVRGNFFIPDPRKFWVKPSVSHLKKYILENNIDTIITTGPPHSMHLIGLRLKELLDVKWIVDIRDPWSKFDLLDHYYIMNFRRTLYGKMEQRVLDVCDKVIATSPSMITQLVGFDKEKFQSITNGYDADDFISYQDQSDPNQLTIYHAGLISAFRNPMNLWASLNLLCGKDGGLAKRIGVQLVGSVESSVISYIGNLSEPNFSFEVEQYKSHDEVLLDYSEANILLLLVNNSDNARVNIPGKTFEYLAAKKPIICVSQQGTDVWNILEQYNHVLLVEYETSAEELVDRLEDFLKDVTVKDFDPSQYSRKSLTSDLVDMLEEL